MVGFKFFFLDDQDWPVPPPTGGPPLGSLALMGVGRIFLVILFVKGFLTWIQ